MLYSEFTLATLQATFQIMLVEQQRLYPAIPDATPSDTFAQLLDYYVPLATSIDTEKARSEFIIAPLLAETRRMTNDQMSIFSGIDFSVDVQPGLRGVCDFIVSRSPEQLYLKAPIITIVEAKNDRIMQGIPQCIAEMIAANRFNIEQSSPIDMVYGVVTTGSLWKFLSLHEQTVHVDRDEYHISDYKKIIGVLLHIVNG